MSATLKIGDRVVVKDTQQKGIIENIVEGKYKLKGKKKPYWPGNLIADKKEKKAIEKFSTIRQKLNAIYSIISREYLLTNKRCRARFAGCTEKATQVHHMQKRTGFFLIMSKLFFPICDHCHKHATQHSKEAVERGISISRHTKVEYNFTEREKNLMTNSKIIIPV